MRRKNEMKGTTLKLIVEMDTQDAQRVIKSGSLASLFSDLNISTDEIENIESEAEKETVAKPQKTENKTVPTTAISYTHDDLAKAAITLMDAGKQPELLGLLQEFNVQAVPMLKEDQIGPFALKLRELGAKI